MFAYSESFNQYIGEWNVSNVIDMRAMFYDAKSFNQDLADWNVSNVVQCRDFSNGALSWELSKPNFINCDPN